MPRRVPFAVTDTDANAAFEPPDGWSVWSSDADGRLVLAYRPDVFDGSTFPPPCLPVCYVTPGAKSRPPGRNPTDRSADDDWFVTLTLEPEVSVTTERVADREAALATARDLTERFHAGDLAYESAYQVPREAYLERLDELTGSGGP